jgi:hypothetical protein
LGALFLRSLPVPHAPSPLLRAPWRTRCEQSWRSWRLSARRWTSGCGI